MWVTVLTVDAGTDFSSETVGSRHMTKRSAIRSLGTSMGGLMINEVPFTADVEKSKVVWTTCGRTCTLEVRPSV